METALRYHMKQHLLEKSICYDGTQLRSHWIYDQTGDIGDAVVAFMGAADVSINHMVDVVDVRNSAPIFSQSMLHILIEHFGIDLEKGILRQRLLVVLAEELLRREVPDCHTVRKGNDLYDGNRKLSVSIAAASPVSCCIHFGINILSEGTPLPTRGLADYRIDPKKFAVTLMSSYVVELETIHFARCKVRPIL